MQKTIPVILFFISVLYGSAQTTDSTFRLVRDKNTDQVTNDDFVELYYSNDSTGARRKVSGIFRSIRADSIGLDMITVRDNNTITLDATAPGQVYRFPVNRLTSVVTVRRKFENAMRVVFFSSLAGALVVSPIVSTENGKLNWAKVGKISGICAIPAVVSVTLALTCWPKHHYLRPNRKTKKIWTLEP